MHRLSIALVLLIVLQCSLRYFIILSSSFLFVVGLLNYVQLCIGAQPHLPYIHGKCSNNACYIHDYSATPYSPHTPALLVFATLNK
jgi:hypothetical protein